MSAPLLDFAENIVVFEAAGKLAFAGPRNEWLKDKKHGETLTYLDDPAESLDPTESLPPKEDLPETETFEDKRAIGDSALWIYYLRAAGSANLALLVVLLTLSVVGQSWPRMLPKIRSKC
jgi:hypothetical protein